MSIVVIQSQFAWFEIDTRLNTETLLGMTKRRTVQGEVVMREGIVSRDVLCNINLVKVPVW